MGSDSIAFVNQENLNQPSLLISLIGKKNGIKLLINLKVPLPFQAADAGRSLLRHIRL
jgi:hypothetical protein